MGAQEHSSPILIIDFGGQTAHLIGRRLRDLGAAVRMCDPDDALLQIEALHPAGIVLSGGPSSVYEVGAPGLDAQVLEQGIPTLGICYGFQLAAHMSGGKVIAGRKEYGPAQLIVTDTNNRLLSGLPDASTVWMSHGDEIVGLPDGFVTIASTDHVKQAAAVWEDKKWYMLQFHPEIEHTQHGNQILDNFITLCGMIRTPHVIDSTLMEEKIRSLVGDRRVIAAVSGGVDSTVAGVLTARAIGDRFTPVFVDNGLMRPDARSTVERVFAPFGVTPIVVDAKDDMLRMLKGITESEQKRKVIGAHYVEVFDETVMTLREKSTGEYAFLMQGTIFSDVIESKGSTHAVVIKSHHNVGGLPKDMKLELLEPLRDLYKDEVRALGRTLGLDEEFISKQSFPGPGYAVRIRGEVTEKRLMQEKMADAIVLEELKKADILKDVFMSFPVMTGAYSTAVKGDGRFMGEVIALRIIESKDIMSTTWSRIPYEVMQTLSTRIVNEVPEVSRVVYDITTKPPATMEWE
jgi:GMP synthase (glutamine-hydrolysing)